MIVVRTVAEARAALDALPRPLGFTPTMGALHAGHLGLVEAARSRCASVAASIFVNPAQFGRGEDFRRYPRDEARDLRLLEEAGVALVFAPAAAEMYPDGFATAVHVGGPLTESLEGASRPGYFDGVTVIVTKLLGVVRPDVLFLGEKDAQQLAVVRRCVRDLDLPVEVVGVPTRREPDGLAMSSRNAYLTAEQRAVAPGLHRALLAGAEAARRPGAAAADVVAAAADALPSPAAGLELDYLAVVDEATFVPEAGLGPRSRLVLAARLGGTRLIDTVSVAVPSNGPPRPTPTTPATSSRAYPVQGATGMEGRTQ